MVDAEATLPVAITARNASPCRGLSICLPDACRARSITFRYSIGQKFDLTLSSALESIWVGNSRRSAMRIGVFSATAAASAAAILAALASSETRAQTKTLYVAAYGGSFEQTMRKDVI